MDYIVNSDLAIEVGVQEALLIGNLKYWLLKNKANNKHFHDNKYWTYNSMEAFTVLFPFWSKRQVERMLKKLKEEGFIETGNYNKSSYDRTLWYTLTDKTCAILFPNEENPFHKKEISISQNGEMENTQMVTPIPNIITNNNNTNNNNTNKTTKSKENNEVVERLWKLYPRKQGKFTEAKVMKVIKEIGEEHLERCIIRYAEECKKENKEKRFILMGSTFINGRYIEYTDENYNEGKEHLKRKNIPSFNANTNQKESINHNQGYGF